MNSILMAIPIALTLNDPAAMAGRGTVVLTGSRAIGAGALLAIGASKVQIIDPNIVFAERGGGSTSKKGTETKGTSKTDNEIKNVYNSIKEAPKYPKDFKNVQNGTKKVNINNQDVLDELRKVEPGQWEKMYKDGFDAKGKKVSIHYFESSSGKVFDVKVKIGWSNQ